MNTEIKNRLRAAIHMEGISNKAIAERIDYSEIHVGKSLSLKHDVLTSKFLTALFEAFPEFAAKHKEQILNGGADAGLFGGDVLALKAENAQLKERLSVFEKALEKWNEEKKWYQDVIAKAIGMHPDIAKLLNPFAQTELGAEQPNNGYLAHKGVNKGAVAIAAA